MSEGSSKKSLIKKVWDLVKDPVIVVVVFLGIHSFAFADEGKLSVTDAWARPVILQNRPGAAYFIIRNDTDRADKLIRVTSPLADRVELHLHKHDGDVMKMMRVEGIPVAAYGSTAVKPGGYHLMMFGLKKKLAVDDELPLTLTFEHAGEIKVMAKVRKTPPKTDHRNMKHEMGK